MLRRRFGCPLSRVSCSPSSSTLSTRGDSVRFSRRSGATYSSVPEDSSGVVRMPTYRRSTNRPFDVFTLASSCISRATFQADSSAAPSAAAATPCARAAASRTARALPPKVIEVEPVVGRDTAVVLQPSHIASQQRLDCAIAGANALFARRGETLDVDVVAVRTAVDAEEQQHGPIQDDADANRPGGEVLQPSHIASQQRLDCAIAGANALFARRGETLDVDVVAVRTAVDAEEQQHGPIQDDADANRPGG